MKIQHHPNYQETAATRIWRAVLQQAKDILLVTFWLVLTFFIILISSALC